MTRKKKQTRKYIPRNEFRFNFDRSSMGHPDYIFGEKDGKYQSFGLTHTPKQEYKHSLLTKNPNAKDVRDSYVQHRVKNTKKHFFSKPLENWHFDLNDLPLIRHLKKKYKKSKNKKRR